MDPEIKRGFNPGFRHLPEFLAAHTNFFDSIYLTLFIHHLSVLQLLFIGYSAVLKYLHLYYFILF